MLCRRIIQFDHNVSAILSLLLVNVLIFCVSSEEFDAIEEPEIIHAFVNASAKEFTYIAGSPQGCKCSFQLFYNDILYNDNGMIIESQHFPQERASRSLMTNKTVFGYLSVHLRIQTIQPSDTGKYTCTFHCKEFDISQSYILRLYYPPSHANCSLQDTTIPIGEGRELQLSSVSCNAAGGYPTGSINCFSYEDSEIVAHSTQESSIAENGMISAEFWMKRSASLHVFCCSRSSIFDKTSASCEDFTSAISSVTSTNEDLTGLEVLDKSVTDTPNNIHTDSAKPSYTTLISFSWFLLLCTIIIVLCTVVV